MVQRTLTIILARRAFSKPSKEVRKDYFPSILLISSLCGRERWRNEWNPVCLSGRASRDFNDFPKYQASRLKHGEQLEKKTLWIWMKNSTIRPRNVVLKSPIVFRLSFRTNSGLSYFQYDRKYTKWEKGMEDDPWYDPDDTWKERRDLVNPLSVSRETARLLSVRPFVIDCILVYIS